MERADPFEARLIVDQLGAIEHAELNIKPLTVFFGPNGTNKTWTAYALYGLLRRFRRSGFPSTAASHIDPWRQPLSRFIDRIEAQLRTAPEFPLRHDIALDGLVGAIPQTVRSTLTGAELGAVLALPDGMPSTSACLEVTAETLAVNQPSIPVFANVTLWNEAFNLNLTYPTASERKSHGGVSWPRTTPAAESRDLIAAALVTSLASLAPDVIAFPAERKALLALYRQLSALNYFGLVLGRGASDGGLSESLASNRVAAARDLGAALPRPSIDFFSFIDALARRPPATEPGPLSPLADVLDHDLLGGRVAFEASAVEGSDRALQFETRHGVIPIQSTHSLLRSLGGLDLYLRHVARPGDVVLIDEPEMNAHPATQIAIAEFIGLMVNAGVRVIATTHSPYIVDHLHNLIEAARLDPDAQTHFAGQFKLKRREAFVSSDLVAAYHFGLDGTVADVFDRTDRLIDWSTFGAEADEVGNLYTALLAAQRDG